jgi:hypothetical protein
MPPTIDVAVLTREVISSAPSGPGLSTHGGSVQVDRRTGDGGLLTEQQAETMAEAMAWLLATPMFKPARKDGELAPRSMTVADRVERLIGYAGAGKTFMLKELITRARRSGAPGWDNPDGSRGMDRGRVVALAPTNNAAKVLTASAGDVIDVCQTVDSFLGLRPVVAKWEKSDDAELARYQSQLAKTGLGQSTADDLLQILIQNLQVRKQAALEQVQEFAPSFDENGVPVLDKSVANVRLLIVDEASMLDARRYGYLMELLVSPAARPDLQILFVGDPAQLPPVGESRSRAFDVGNLSPLTEVVRYSGQILEYCTAVRQPDSEYRLLHPGASSAYSLKQDQTFFSLPYKTHDPGELDGITAMAGVFRGGAHSARILCATNKDVWLANALVREAIYGSRELDYREGDTLLTMAACNRDKYGNCNVRRGGKPFIGTRQLIVLSDVRPKGIVWVRKGVGYFPPETLLDSVGQKNDFVGYTPLPEGADHSAIAPVEGYTYFKLWEADWFYEGYEEPDQANYHPVILMDPNQFSDYMELTDRIGYLARALKSRPVTKLSREATGKGPEEACKYLGIATRWKHHDGREITAEEFDTFSKKMWRNFFALQQQCDRIGYSYAGTVHSAQGQTLDVVAIDTGFMREDKGRSRIKGDESWDPRKILYTSATRAALQLIFLIRYF